MYNDKGFISSVPLPSALASALEVENPPAFDLFLDPLAPFTKLANDQKCLVRIIDRQRLGMNQDDSIKVSSRECI